MRKLLELRAAVGAKRPKFDRVEGWKHGRMVEGWRKPRGIHNKVREQVKGWPPLVKVGYRGPRATRGLHPSGYVEVLVHSASELEGLDPARQAIRVAAQVGARKREGIIRIARSRGLRVLNA